MPITLSGWSLAAPFFTFVVLCAVRRAVRVGLVKPGAIARVSIPIVIAPSTISANMNTVNPPKPLHSSSVGYEDVLSGRPCAVGIHSAASPRLVLIFALHPIHLCLNEAFENPTSLNGASSSQPRKPLDAAPMRFLS
ncbi:hypothetical protein PYCCODRAFT_747539 [Trametes coccinea BRFM310]|uniref:Secreted protein n=1 Tax=Trametes coccinea (strain BRFM310) TaxID=1353009 RepID=A0A1Y2IGK4_TRAC3|nr:hypothetical protein PYCCODRAFT_747539 [Trametes coccinea BRFM310]